MTITLEQYLTYHPEPDTAEHAAWVTRLIKEAGPDIWSHTEKTDRIINDFVRRRMAPDTRGLAIVRFAARQALRAALGPRGYWLLGWYEEWLPSDAEREYWWMWEHVKPIVDDVIGASFREGIRG